MKILVGIKRVVDYNVRVRVLPDGSGVDTDGVKMSVNPFDEIALEEALRLREAGKAEEVIVVSAGGDECQQQLRTGLAMGADRAIQVKTDRHLQPLTVAKAFLKLIEREAGLETIEVELPAVISVDLRLNEPRFVKLPDIMKAKRKPLDVVALDELGVAAEGDLEVSHFEPPKPREKGIMVEDAAQLVVELKNRGLL